METPTVHRGGRAPLEQRMEEDSVQWQAHLQARPSPASLCSVPGSFHARALQPVFELPGMSFFTSPSLSLPGFLKHPFTGRLCLTWRWVWSPARAATMSADCHTPRPTASFMPRPLRWHQVNVNRGNSSCRFFLFLESSLNEQFLLQVVASRVSLPLRHLTPGWREVVTHPGDDGDSMTVSSCEIRA